MGMTSTFTIDAIGNPEPIVVHTVCSKVTVQENGLIGTEDYLIYGSPKDTPVTYPAGRAKVFEAAKGAYFYPGQIIGYLAASATSMVFSQEEE